MEDCIFLKWIMSMINGQMPTKLVFIMLHFACFIILNIVNHSYILANIHSKVSVISPSSEVKIFNWEPTTPHLVELQHSKVDFSIDYNLETIRHYSADGSSAALAFQSIAIIAHMLFDFSKRCWVSKANMYQMYTRLKKWSITYLLKGLVWINLYSYELSLRSKLTKA